MSRLEADFCNPERYETELDKILQRLNVKASEGVPFTMTFHGIQCKWWNSLLKQSVVGHDIIIETDSEQGGDGGLEKIPQMYWGKKTKITFAIEVLKGRAQVGVDNYGFAPYLLTKVSEAPFEGELTIETDIPRNGQAIAIVRAASNSKVKIKWITLESRG